MAMEKAVRGQENGICFFSGGDDMEKENNKSSYSGGGKWKSTQTKWWNLFEIKWVFKQR